MAKFRELERCLFDCGLADSSQIHRPLPVPRRWLELVHQRHQHIQRTNDVHRFVLAILHVQLFEDRHRPAIRLRVEAGIIKEALRLGRALAGVG